VKVLVARRDLKANELIWEPEKLFSEVTYRAGEEPARAVSPTRQLKGRVVRNAVQKGYPLTEDDLGVRIPEGQQCICLRVSDKGVAPGYIERLAGTRVSLVLLVESPTGDEGVAGAEMTRQFFCEIRFFCHSSSGGFPL
jgi:hypothetical protein